MTITPPIRPTTDDARALAQDLIACARHAALGVIDPDTGAPHVSRIAFGSINGVPVTLISDLALHSRAIRQNPDVSVLIGEPGPKGDPLTYPRLTLQASACPIARNTAEHAKIRGLWLETHPKAALYIDFADFAFVKLTPISGALNGGFGKAFALTAADLGPSVRLA